MEFAGKGNRKPQLDISIELINLDKKNPRLVPYLPDPENATQNDLVSILFENFDTESLALSMIANGYFDEEPIIVVPNESPVDFSFSSYSDFLIYWRYDIDKELRKQVTEWVELKLA